MRSKRMRRESANWCDEGSPPHRVKLRTTLALEADPAQHLLSADTPDFVSDPVRGRSHVDSTFLRFSEVDPIMLKQLLHEGLDLPFRIRRVWQTTNNDCLGTGSTHPD